MLVFGLEPPATVTSIGFEVSKVTRSPATGFDGVVSGVRCIATGLGGGRLSSSAREEP